MNKLLKFKHMWIKIAVFWYKRLSRLQNLGVITVQQWWWYSLTNSVFEQNLQSRKGKVIRLKL